MASSAALPHKVPMECPLAATTCMMQPPQLYLT
jgi:hypothetical protein